MENNKALEKELIEETGVSQTEINKYLHESVHLNEDKRKNLFRWYLEKKLSRMESGTTSIFISTKTSYYHYLVKQKMGSNWVFLTGFLSFSSIRSAFSDV